MLCACVVSLTGIVVLALAPLALPGVAVAQAPPPCPLLTPPFFLPFAEGADGDIFFGQVPGACRGEQTHFRATIDWGDRTRPDADGTVDLNGGVVGGHAFRRAGAYVATATVTDQRSGARQVFRRPLQVRNQPLRAGPRVVVRGGRLRVARFRDANRLAEPRDFTVRVRAGGRAHRARVVRDGATGFAVILARRLPARATRVVVRIADDRGARLTITSPRR